MDRRVPSYDLVIRNGTVVGPGLHTRADVGVSAGRIAQLGGEMSGQEEIDASGKLVLPGCVDVHVHITGDGPTDQPTWVDDFTSGTAAALAGGVTTVGNMSALRADEDLLQGLQRVSTLARKKALADVILHPIIQTVTPAVINQLGELLQHGHNSIKYFMVMKSFEEQAEAFLRLTQAAGEAGLITMVHCEDASLVNWSSKRLVEQGKTAPAYYPQARPVAAELAAVQRAIAFAEVTGAPVYIVHLASARALDACRKAQAVGIPVYVETRPVYLHLTRERFREADGAKYVGAPPLRSTADREALWRGLQQGTVHTLGSDHAPWLLADKLDPSLTVATYRQGVENLEYQLAMLYSEGVRQGRLSLQRLVEVTSTNPAKLFGLFPRKGSIAPGSDADLVIFDPQETRTIRTPHHSRADYSPYEGFEVTGWPEITIRRGEVVYADGRVQAQPGSGQVIPRGKTQLL